VGATATRRSFQPCLLLAGYAMMIFVCGHVQEGAGRLPNAATDPLLGGFYPRIHHPQVGASATATRRSFQPCLLLAGYAMMIFVCGYVQGGAGRLPNASFYRGKSSEKISLDFCPDSIKCHSDATVLPTMPTACGLCHVDICVRACPRNGWKAA
jgi:hypothetical protein